MSSDKKKRKVEAKDDDDEEEEDLERWTYVFGGGTLVDDCLQARAQIIGSKASRSKRLKALRKLYSHAQQVYGELGQILSEEPDTMVDMDPDDLE